MKFVLLFSSAIIVGSVLEIRPAASCYSVTHVMPACQYNCYMNSNGNENPRPNGQRTETSKGKKRDISLAGNKNSSSLQGICNEIVSRRRRSVEDVTEDEDSIQQTLDTSCWRPAQNLTKKDGTCNRKLSVGTVVAVFTSKNSTDGKYDGGVFAIFKECTSDHVMQIFECNPMVTGRSDARCTLKIYNVDDDVIKKFSAIHLVDNCSKA